ncbi:hypothetical protein ACQKPE_24225, partial [Pseudomonas sp. NPDC089554]|uniref:hypothetical protein n=1 Tax=Pseudomonas sp. NPDC089554 TaxID=3390653 RepID=UPI003D027AA4
NLLSTAFFTAIDTQIEALPILPEAFNSLIFKGFYASTTSEVGRIIRATETPSSLCFENIASCKQTA